MTKWLLCVLSLLIALPVSAQVPVNPTSVTFDHVDYAGTTDYEAGYFSDATAPAPVQTGIMPKPASCAPCAGSLPSRPTAFQTWYVAIRARVGTVAPFVVSDWSNRVVFERRPVAPTVLAVK